MTELLLYSVYRKNVWTIFGKFKFMQFRTLMTFFALGIYLLIQRKLLFMILQRLFYYRKWGRDSKLRGEIQHHHYPASSGQ